MMFHGWKTKTKTKEDLSVFILCQNKKLCKDIKPFIVTKFRNINIQNIHILDTMFDKKTFDLINIKDQNPLNIFFIHPSVEMHILMSLYKNFSSNTQYFKLDSDLKKMDTLKDSFQVFDQTDNTLTRFNLGECKKYTRLWNYISPQVLMWGKIRKQIQVDDLVLLIISYLVWVKK